MPEITITECPACGTALEQGVIEGYYLAWFTKRTGLGGVLRCISGGLAIAGGQRLGGGPWPSVLRAARCPSCGVGAFYPPPPLTPM
jgi:hypothetical protein